MQGPEAWEDLLADARRRSRSASDAEDLVQDALLVAAKEGRTDVEDPATRRWLKGVIRNLALETARKEGRRRRRERAVELPVPAPVSADGVPIEAVLGRLSRGARSVALLVVHGLGPAEIAQALDLSAAAFRQRLTTLRRELAGVSPELRREALALAFARRTREAAGLDLGPLRRALLACVRFREGVGTHDPDGHLLVISKSASLQTPPRQR